MRDLTQGSIPKHLISLAVPIGIGMAFQMLYVLIDLYFVSRLGDAAIAGVGAAGNLQFLVMAASQVLGVGGMALIAQACGRKDADDANTVFNQSLLLASLAAAITLIAGYACSGAYMRTIAADAASAAAGTAYLHAFLPGLALQFALVALGAALRGTGISKPTMLVQIVTVVLNAILAPVLIAGWLTGRAFGVAGAGWASSISIAVGVALMLLYFARLERYVGVDARRLRPQPPVWRRILAIGLPPGGEFALMFVFMAVTYWCLRGLGTDAQAGYGIGMRVMQAIFLPIMAIAFAVAPVAGQNVGAGRGERVLATFRSAASIGSAAMLALTLLCQWRPEWFMRPFAGNAQAAEVAADFLRIVSWNFVASGLIFTCSGMFQALGNTRPSLYASASRLPTFALPAIWLSQHPGFEPHRLWLLSVGTTVLQALTVLWLLRRELRRRLPAMAQAAAR